MAQLFNILLIIGLTSIYINAQTCGDGPAVSSFEAEILSKLENKGGLDTQFNTWQATNAAEAANAQVPKVCEAAFTGKKSCCVQGTIELFKNIYKATVNQKLQAVNGWSGSKKVLKGDKFELELRDGLKKCQMDYLAKHPELNTTSASASISVSGTSVSVSISIPSSIQKALKAMDNMDKKGKALLKKGAAEFGLMSLRLFRGTMCALCMDPDAVISTIWDGSAVLVKDTDVNDIVGQVKQNLLDAIEGAKAKHQILKLRYKARLEAMECTDLLKKIEDYKPDTVYCANDAGCATTPNGCVTSAWAVSDDCLTAPPTASSLRRELQASTLKASATGVAGQTADDTEDAAITVNGQSATQLQTQAKTADDELKAEPLNESDAEAIYGVPASSNIVAVTLSIMAFLIASLL